MKKFFEEYGFIILTCVVVIALVGIAIGIKPLMASSISNITNSWGSKAKESLDNAWNEDGSNESGGSSGTSSGSSESGGSGGKISIDAYIFNYNTVVFNNNISNYELNPVSNPVSSTYPSDGVAEGMTHNFTNPTSTTVTSGTITYTFIGYSLTPPTEITNASASTASDFNCITSYLVSNDNLDENTKTTGKIQVYAYWKISPRSKVIEAIDDDGTITDSLNGLIQAGVRDIILMKDVTTELILPSDETVSSTGMTIDADGNTLTLTNTKFVDSLDTPHNTTIQIKNGTVKLGGCTYSASESEFCRIFISNDGSYSVQMGINRS